MKTSETPEIFEIFLDDFAKRHDIRREHLNAVIQAIFDGTRFYIQSEEMPTVRLNNFFVYKASPFKIKKRLLFLWREYRKPFIPKQKQYSILEEYTVLNRVRKRRNTEIYLTKRKK